MQQIMTKCNNKIELKYTVCVDILTIRVICLSFFYILFYIKNVTGHIKVSEYREKGDGEILKKTATYIVAKMMKKILDYSIYEGANTASCGMFYQPKAPNEIIKFKRKYK